MNLDLFAGPGGWEASGLDLDIIGVELDKAACATRAAAGLLTVRQDVTTLDTDLYGALDGLIASPPCPTFSNAGDRAGMRELRFLVEHVHRCATGWRPYERPAAGDPRTALVLEPLRFALDCLPTWIALEQVPEVLPVWEAMQYVLRAHGWSCWTGILCAADYGVPQTRRRAILIAHRGREVTAPEPTHCEGGALTMFGELAPWVSMAEALGWNGHAVLEGRGYDTLVRSTDEPSFTICAGHDNGDFAYVNTGKDWKPGGTRDDAQRIPVTEPAPTVAAGHGGAALWWLERPSTTVTTERQVWPPGHKINSDDIDRLGEAEARARYGTRGQGREGSVKLTAADALRLQSFPADYPVRGTKTKQFEQIGNAIPPLLARAVLGVLVEGW